MSIWIPRRWQPMREQGHEFSEWEIRYLPVRARSGEKDVVLRTHVLNPGGELIDLDYWMHHKDGRRLVFDVKVSGVSLLANERSTFRRMAKPKGIAGLIEDLAVRNAMRRCGSWGSAEDIVLGRLRC